MTIQEIREKRTKLLLDAQRIMSGENVTAEQRTSAAAIFADANTLQSDIQMLETIETETRSTSNGSVPRGNPGESTDTRSIDERKAATAKAIRTYLTTGVVEKRDLTVSANGGVLIPVGVTDPKIALKSAGSIYDLVYKLSTDTGEAIKAPLLNDVTNGFVLNSTATSTTDPATGGVTISIDDIRSNVILIDNSLLQDVGFDLVNFVETSIQSRYMRTVSNWITNGNGSNVGGLASITQGLTGNTVAQVKYVDFTGLLAALDPAYAAGATFVMSNATLANNVLNILDSNGRPIFLPFNDGGISGFAGTIFGYPVKLNPYQPTVATGNIAVQFGNFTQGYTFREVKPGPVVQRLNERYADINRTGFVSFARVGGAVTQASTAVSPIVSLTIK